MPVTVPLTTTITNHGLLIKVNSGQVVGAITSWAPRHSRTVTPVFEFGQITTGAGHDVPANSGEPYENVPGNAEGMELTINRYDLYTTPFETAFGSFGTAGLEMLTNQTSNLVFTEYTTSPDGTITFVWAYYGAWFTSLGRNYDAKGDRIVMANASARYTRRRRIG